MAWVATDNFEADSPGDIAGQGGGTGWTGNWALASGSNANFQIVSTPVAEGTRAASVKAVGGYVERTLATGATSGSLYILLRRNSTSGSTGARLRMPNSGAASEYDIGFYGSAIVLFNDGGNHTIESGLSADTWYEMNVEFDTTVPQFRARVRPQLGTWGSFSSYYAPYGSTTGAILSLGLQALGSDSTFTYFDRISDTEEPAAGGTFKTWNGVALADIKTINGVA